MVGTVPTGLQEQTEWPLSMAVLAFAGHAGPGLGAGGGRSCRGMRDCVTGPELRRWASFCAFLDNGLREEAPWGPLQLSPPLSNAPGNLGRMLGLYLSECL